MSSSEVLVISFGFLMPKIQLMVYYYGQITGGCIWIFKKVSRKS